jgi:hypothetical protein
VAEHTTIVAIALCAICAFTFITCIAMRASRPDEPGDDGVEQSIEIKVPAIISFQFRTKRCNCSQQETKVTPDSASNAASLPDAEPDTRPLPHLQGRRHQDHCHQDPGDAGIPAREDSRREG